MIGFCGSVGVQKEILGGGGIMEKETEMGKDKYNLETTEDAIQDCLATQTEELASVLNDNSVATERLLSSILKELENISSILRMQKHE